MSVYLKYLRVANYRSITSLELTGFRGINTFIGPNNSGKTTLLHAIYALITGSLGRSDFRLTSSNVLPIVLKGVFEINDTEVDHQITHFLDSMGIEDKEDRKALGAYLRLFAVERITQAGQSSGPKVSSAVEARIPSYISDLHWAFLKSDSLKSGMTALGSELGNYLTKRVIPSFQPEHTCYVPSNRLGQTFQARLRPGTTDSVTSQAALHAWKESPQRRTLERTLDELKQLDPTFSRVDPRTSGLFFELAVQGDEAIELNLREKGVGEQDIIEIGARLRNPILKPGFVLIDEPENSKHPLLQRTLRQWLLSLSREHQVFLASHSAIFAVPGQDSAVIVLGNDGVRILGPDPGSGGNEAIRSAVGIKNTDIFGFNTVLFVEGDTEHNFVFEVAPVLLPDSLPLSIRIVNLQGADKFKFTRLREFMDYLRDTWVKVFVWLDLKEGILKAKEEFLSRYSRSLFKDSVVVWSKGNRSLVDFEDMFPSDVLADSLAVVVEQSGGGPFDRAAFLKACNKGAVRALETTYAKSVNVHRSSFPKADFGIALGRCVAAEVSSAAKFEDVQRRYPAVNELIKALK